MAFLACGGDKNALSRQTEGYEIVEEGSAAGVTGTLHAPGEVIAPTTELTGTNLDTTTAFTTLDPIVGQPEGDPQRTLSDTLALPPDGYATPVATPHQALPRPEPARPTPTTSPRYEERPRATPTPQSTPVIDIRRSEPTPTPRIEVPSEPAEPEPEWEPEPEPEPDPEPEPEADTEEDS